MLSMSCLVLCTIYSSKYIQCHHCPDRYNATACQTVYSEKCNTRTRQFLFYLLVLCCAIFLYRFVPMYVPDAFYLTGGGSGGSGYHSGYGGSLGSGDNCCGSGGGGGGGGGSGGIVDYE